MERPWLAIGTNRRRAKDAAEIGAGSRCLGAGGRRRGAAASCQAARKDLGRRRRRRRDRVGRGGALCALWAEDGAGDRCRKSSGRSSASSAARHAPHATRRKRRSGTDRSTRTPWRTRPTRPVLGDFNDASFDYYGVHSRFFRKDGKFFVETDGADGKLAAFEVKYTFGARSLAAISRRVSRRAHPGAVARLGQPAEGPGRPALVPPLSE